jgi:hypothetical protein
MYDFLKINFFLFVLCFSHLVCELFDDVSGSGTAHARDAQRHVHLQTKHSQLFLDSQLFYDSQLF